jgi:hypothetical protein
MAKNKKERDIHGNDGTLMTQFSSTWQPQPMNQREQ